MVKKNITILIPFFLLFSFTLMADTKGLLNYNANDFLPYGVLIAGKDNVENAKLEWVNNPLSKKFEVEWDTLWGIPISLKSKKGTLTESSSLSPHQILQDFILANAKLFKLEKKGLMFKKVAESIFNEPLIIKGVEVNPVYNVELIQLTNGIEIFGSKIIGKINYKGELIHFWGHVFPQTIFTNVSILTPEDVGLMVLKDLGVDMAILMSGATEEGWYKLKYSNYITMKVKHIIFPYGFDYIYSYKIIVNGGATNDFEYIVNTTDGSILYKRFKLKFAPYGKHYPSLCDPYSEENYPSNTKIICENPTARLYGDPGSDIWPCVNTDCFNPNDPNYILCCTRSNLSRYRITSILEGIDGSWSYPARLGNWKTSGNNIYAIKNSTTCCPNPPCNIDCQGSDCAISDCCDERILDCIFPYVDKNFTDDPGYEHELDYSLKVFEDDPNSNPYNYGPASVANGFYWANWYHDYLYNLGFTEPYKNFQNDNYGRGGVGNDQVIVSFLFASNYLNEAPYPDDLCCWDVFLIFPICGPASSTSTTDGEKIKIYLPVCDISLTDNERDSGLARDVLLHEYQHGVTTRLLGDSCYTQSGQCGAMQEGWSDFFAISNNDPLLGEYIEDYINGVRHYRYDLNSYTYGDLCTINGGCEEHNDGEIWAATLYTLRNNLKRKYSKIYTHSDTGKFYSEYYTLWGIYQGCGANPPSMLRERNNILDVDDQTRTGAPERAIIWKSFASRGFGLTACSGIGCETACDGSPCIPGLEGQSADAAVKQAFDVPKEMRFVEYHEYLNAPFEWHLGLSDEGEYTVFQLPFCFPFYGLGCYSTITIGANGGIRMGQYQQISYNNIPFPTNNNDAPHIAVIWDDWNPGGDPNDSNDIYFGCYYASSDISPNEYAKYCVVSYQTIKNYVGETTSTFQVVLFPSGNIIFKFENIGDGVSGNNDITIGLNKGDGVNAVIPYDTSSPNIPISNGDSVAFIYNPVSGSYRYDRSDYSTWVTRKDFSEKLLMGDDTEITKNLPFDFLFSSSLGTKYSTMRIGTNGGIKLANTGEIGWNNQDFPFEDNGPNDTQKGHPHISPLWEDLDATGTSDDKDVYSWSNSQNDTFAVTWYKVWHHSYPSNEYTFQAVIFNTGDIIYHYGDLGSLLYEVTVGINDPRDLNEPQNATTIHTSYASQYGTKASPKVSDYTTHYYFLNERF